jgi:hypothetical protein
MDHTLELPGRTLVVQARAPTREFSMRTIRKNSTDDDRTVQRIWEAGQLQPHRWRTFKRSKDRAFAEKVEDIVGLYMHPPAHAV